MPADVIRNHLRNGEPELARVGALGALQSCPEADRGELFALLARALHRLGQPRKAMEYAEEAARRVVHWEASLALAEAMVGLGEPVGARAVLTEALKRVRADASEEPDALVGLGAALAEAWRAAGEPRAAIEIAREAVREARHHHGEGSAELAEALHELGVCLHGAGEHLEARGVLDTALQIRRAESRGTSDHAATLDALGAVHRRLRAPAAAVALHREALSLWEANFGPGTGPEGACRHSLAQALHDTGDFHGARAEMDHAWRLTSRALGPDHVDTWITAFELGRLELDCGDAMEGMQRMEAARSVVRERLGAGHPVVKAMDRWL